jgi:hypothetical protein
MKGEAFRLKKILKILRLLKILKEFDLKDFDLKEFDFNIIYGRSGSKKKFKKNFYVRAPQKRPVSDARNIYSINRPRNPANPDSDHNKH